jgi:hypothetical protein
MAKGKVQKDEQQSTKHTHKTKDQVTCPGTKNDPTETQFSWATSQFLNINFEK